MDKKVILLILDGWGCTADPEVSAIAQARTPYIDQLLMNYPNATLRTDGRNVGLPEGQMGNSEVGHMNLGAGRIVYQDLAKISIAVEEGHIAQEKVLLDALRYAKKQQKKVHFIGLLSDGGVHSHIQHLGGLLQVAKEQDLDQVYVHAFTDGRDVDPKSSIHYIQQLQEMMEKSTGKLASIIGRYYAMDRDRRWERVSEAYHLLTDAKGKAFTDPVEAIEQSYKNGYTDEFIQPIVLTEHGQPIATIEKEDVVIFFNFRTDRGRQLTQALTQTDFPEYGMYKIPLRFVTLTSYDDSFTGIEVVYRKENLENTLGEILEKNNKTQIRIAETEKYPHVTYFFSGGREVPFEGEKRILCPSPKVATYDLQPEMSAYDIRDKIIPELKNRSADFICLNFANPDMVGHTGDFKAAILACETIDKCVKEVVDQAIEAGYTSIILADHGNSEKMRNNDGSPNTAHTTNPVPIIVVDKDIKEVKSGILGDIAPTILKLLNIKQPKEMTQKPLI